MAGYSGFSMSNNAVDAYAGGLRPASKITGVPAKLVAEYVSPREWHHCSKEYNRVNFFSPGEARAIFGLESDDSFPANPLAVAALAAHKASRKDAGQIYDNCTVNWLEWGGTKARPRAYERVETGCRVEVKGQTATVTLPPRGSLAIVDVMVKRLTTRGFSFSAAVKA